MNIVGKGSKIRPVLPNKKSPTIKMVRLQVVHQIIWFVLRFEQLKLAEPGHQLQL
ncbi:hypothetical protein JCM31185_14360 [Furfurilactobacillus curtus]|uniref:Uncharacterized protein n=1 Tax=Furfurilactobacillus curtus TaxID=1746200 RepID=A0ABQ5JP83_9LACO